MQSRRKSRRFNEKKEVNESKPCQAQLPGPRVIHYSGNYIYMLYVSGRYYL